MGRKIFHFIKYNNFFTLGVLFIFLSSGIALAANPAVRDGILSESQQLKSVDNTYLIKTDLDKYNFNFKILGITEDSDNYYVNYSYVTIDLDDYIWRDVTWNKNLVVSKLALNGRDLGIFVSDQLGQLIDSQLTYLKNAQKTERSKGDSRKVVTTQYNGLIGRMLSATDKTFDGYNPVIIPKPEEKPEVVSVPTSEKLSQSIPASVLLAMRQEKKVDEPVEEVTDNTNPEPSPEPVEPIPQDPEVSTNPATTTPSSSATTTPETSSNPPITPADTEPPVIVLVGDSPLIVQVGSTYVDPGATARDNSDPNVSITVNTEGVNTTLPGTYQVTYTATDVSGNVATLTRAVNVEGSVPVTPPTEQATSTPAQEPDPQTESETTDQVTEPVVQPATNPVETSEPINSTDSNPPETVTLPN